VNSSHLHVWPGDGISQPADEPRNWPNDRQSRRAAWDLEHEEPVQLHVQGLASGFRIGEVSADAAYLSHDNIEMVGKAGGTPYICFKSNTTAAGGGLMAKMFHFYNLNRDEYLAHYHKRSNVETTNAMIKAKVGDSIRSKTDVAMTNEALAKVLCHNLCCLIQSHYELGIKCDVLGQGRRDSQGWGGRA
jgi:hypothetical protein